MIVLNTMCEVCVYQLRTERAAAKIISYYIQRAVAKIISYLMKTKAARNKEVRSNLFYSSTYDDVIHTCNVAYISCACTEGEATQLLLTWKKRVGSSLLI